jgi:S1-C subfamily serine protease
VFNTIQTPTQKNEQIMNPEVTYQLYANEANEAAIQNTETQTQVTEQKQEAKQKQKLNYKSYTAVISKVNPNDTSYAFGSGFYVKENIVCTAAHVLVNKNNYVNGELAKVLYKNDKADIALLQVETKETPVPFSNTPINIGDTIYSYGNSGCYLNSLTKGIVNHTCRVMYENNKTIRMVFQHQIPVYPGGSGGAILNENFEVVGMVSAGVIEFAGRKVDGINFGIQLSNIKLALKTIDK